MRDNSPDIYCHSRTLQKLIKDVVKAGVEDIVYAAIQALSRKERELLQNKGNRNTNLTALLKSGKYLDTPIPPSWPTAEFSIYPYNKDLDHQVHFHTFLDVNA